jgi:hypothetical protein
MSAWRRQIIERLPEFRTLAETAENPMALWIELLYPCEEACKRGDGDLVSRVYAAARWFFESPSDDLRTAVVCAFYEHLPRSAMLWEDLPRRMSHSEFRTIRPCLEYHSTPEQIERQERRLVEIRAEIAGGLL